jgi:hypothetical protein
MWVKETYEKCIIIEIQEVLDKFEIKEHISEVVIAGGQYVNGRLDARIVLINRKINEGD